MPIYEDLSTNERRQWASLLRDLLDTAARRASSDIWTVWDRPCIAREEVSKTERLRCSDGSTWGPMVSSTVYPIVAMLINATREHAVAALLALESESPVSLVIDTLAKGAVEPASSAYWLLDEQLNGRERVARMYVFLRSTATKLEITASKMGIPMRSSLGPSESDVDAYYRDYLGLHEDCSKKGNWVGCEGQSRTAGYTARAEEFLGALGHPVGAGIYGVLCGSAHGEFWRIRYGYSTVLGGGPSPSRLVEFTVREYVRIALGVIVESLLYPLAASFALLGRGASINDLARLEAPLRRALK